FDIHRAQLPLPQRVIDTRRKSSLLLVLADFQPDLDQCSAAIDDVFFDLRAKLEKTSVLLLRAKPHDVFDAGAVVPTAVEDHDLATCRELLDVALHEHLSFLTIRGGRQGHYPKHPRAHALGDRLDGPALTGGIAPLEHDDDARSRFFDPILQMAKLDL